MAEHRKWSPGTSSRGSNFLYCNGKHLSLNDIKEDHPDHYYLSKEGILSYPRCLFSASKVCHVTDLNAVRGILKDRGFSRGNDNYVWWDLLAKLDHCVSAKMKTGATVLSWENFITSPAFQTKSRYGNFCFTFELRELLQMYSRKHCRSTAPILRVMDTKLFKQEVEYSVLVHPKYMRHYRKYDRLPFDDTFLCAYSQKKMSWQCQSPSDKYEHYVEVDNKGKEVGIVRPLQSPEYYAWDHVAVAFHVKRDRLLQVDRRRLLNSLSVCEMVSNKPEMSVYEAKAEVEKLKKKYTKTIC